MELTLKKGKKSPVQAIQEIAKLYFIALRKVREEGLRDSMYEPSDYEKYISRVQNAFDSLTDIEKEFINNDFFYQAYPNWWMKYYTRYKYYSIRKQSMMSFLEAFEYEA